MLASSSGYKFTKLIVPFQPTRLLEEIWNPNLEALNTIPEAFNLDDIAEKTKLLYLI